MSEPKMYPDWESAQEALDRGETVRIEMAPFKIDPALVQLALDLQAKERLEEWRKMQEYRERRILFFAAIRQPEMRWVREAFKHLKHDQGIDWRAIQSIELDPPWEIDGFSKQSWTMTTDTFVTMLLDPSRYDGIEDFSTYLFHDARNAYCECIWCYDATMAKRRAESEVSHD